MKSNNSNTAVVWENELQALKNALTSFNLKGYEVWPNHNGFRSKTTFLLRDEEGNSITGSWNYDRLNHFILGYGKAFEKANNPQPKESTHITWWKGLNEEEQTKLCQKHFQGIPVESLMERSIKVMFHYENPETTTNTVTGEIKLWVTGSGVRSENLTANDVLIRTDDATIHLDKDSEFGKLAHAMINRYNSHDSLVSALKEAMEDLKNLACNYADYSTNESNPYYIGKLASYAKAKQVLNQINQL
jgi:hypothetical protein